MSDRQPAPALAGVGRERHARPRRLETEQPALRRRDADRSAAVGGVRHRQHAGDDRRGRPAGRATGRMLEVPRVAAGPVQARLRVRVQPELRRRAAAHDHQPGLLAARHVGAVVVGDIVGKQAAAEPCRLALLEERQVLDQVRHAPQRRILRPIRRRRVRRFTRPLVLLVHDGVDGGVDLLGARDRRLQHLPCRHLAPGDQPGKRGGIVLAVLVETHGDSLLA